MAMKREHGDLGGCWGVELDVDISGTGGGGRLARRKALGMMLSFDEDERASFVLDGRRGGGTWEWG